MSCSCEEQANKLPIPLDCKKLPDFRFILDKMDNKLKQEELQRKRELKKQVDLATFESLKEDLSKDVSLVQDYNEALRLAQETWQGMVQSYKRNRHLKGLEKTESIMKDRLCLVGLQSLVELPRHYSLFKANAEKDAYELRLVCMLAEVSCAWFVELHQKFNFYPDNTVTFQSRETLCVLDFGKPPTISIMVEMIKTCADIVHQSSAYALFIKYPVRTKSMCVKTHLNAVRKIEDTMMLNNLNIDCSIGVVYDTASFHGNDTREGTARTRLAISNNFPDSAWLSNNAISNHMRVNGVQLLSHSNMKIMAHDNIAYSNEHLSPAERAAQLGPKAWQALLKALVCGREGQGEIQGRTVVVVDPWPQWGDVLEASWDIYRQWSDGGDVPGMTALGIYVTKDPYEESRMGGLTSVLRGHLLRTWWELSAEAGSAEPGRSEATTVRKPDLKLLSWDTAKGTVTVPDLVTARFDDGDCKDEWRDVCADAMKQIKKFTSLGCADVRRAGSNIVGVQLTGPDFETDGPLDVNRDLTEELEFANCADLDKSEVLPRSTNSQ